MPSGFATKWIASFVHIRGSIQRLLSKWRPSKCVTSTISHYWLLVSNFRKQWFGWRWRIPAWFWGYSFPLWTSNLEAGFSLCAFVRWMPTCHVHNGARSRGTWKTAPWGSSSNYRSHGHQIEAVCFCRAYLHPSKRPDFCPFPPLILLMVNGPARPGPCFFVHGKPTWENPPGVLQWNWGCH